MEEFTLKPGAQRVIMVRPGAGESSEGEGLITPMRSKQILNCKFSTAYGFVDNGVRQIVIANVTGEEIKISKNRMVAEFHPREKGTYLALHCGKEQGGQEECFAAAACSDFYKMKGGCHCTGGRINVATRIGCDRDPSMTHTVCENTREKININNNSNRDRSYNSMGDDHIVTPESVDRSCPESHPSPKDRGPIVFGTTERGSRPERPNNADTGCLDRPGAVIRRTQVV